MTDEHLERIVGRMQNEYRIVAAQCNGGNNAGGLVSITWEPVPVISPPFWWCQTCRALQMVQRGSRYTTAHVGYTLTCGHTWEIEG